MQLARLSLIASLAFLIACPPATSPAASAQTDLALPAGGLQTLRVEAILDVEDELTGIRIPLPEEERSGRLWLEISPLNEASEDARVEVTLANLGMGEVQQQQLRPTAGGTSTVPIALFPCQQLCSTEVLVTIASDIDAAFRVVLRADHDASLAFDTDEALLLEVFDEDGAPLDGEFGDD